MLRLVEHLLRCHRDDLGIGRHKAPAFDQADKLGPDLARYLFADAPVLLDIPPFADQIEMVGVAGVAAQHAVFDLCRRAVKRVVVAVVELVEELDELVAPAGFDPEVVDVKVVALGCQRYQSRPCLLWVV